MRTPVCLLLALLSTISCHTCVAAASDPLPVIIWHGLGDRYDADGLASVGDLIRKVHPSTHVYNIRLADNGKDDQRASFLGNVDEQIDSVCKTLQHNPNLTANSNEPLRVDAIGFSQGGQFLRGLIQRCEPLHVRSLLTFGSQHNGITRFGTCGPWDLVCRATVAAAKGRAFSEWAQDNVVPAQYYRQLDPETGAGSETYLNASHFLADINNERHEKTEVYKTRLSELSHFVMYVFENDTTAIPKESGWFADVLESTGDDDDGDREERTVVPLRQRRIYTEDWIGLKALDEKGALAFPLIKDAGHMQLDEELLESAFRTYLGPETAARGSRWSWSAGQRVLV